MIDYTEEIKSVLRLSSDLTEEEMSKVTGDTNIASLGIDSLSLVEAVIELEKKFKIDIELDGPWMDELVLTINGLNEMINGKLNG
jgi:acyl carrier protein